MITQRFGCICILIAILQGVCIHAFADVDEYPRSKEGNLMVNVVDILFAAKDVTLRLAFKGKTIEIIGQLMADANSPKGNRFKLMRMFMPDESINTIPVAVMVENSTKPTGAIMSWIKVTGRVEFPDDGSKTIPVIKATKVEAVNPPKDVYLY
jgi:uncharacterized membrane protein YcgQ (UPF0703/DUF1980 family)